MQKVLPKESEIYDTEAIKSQGIYELRQLFKYRFLIQNLISRDLKVRYKRSALGFIWVMLNPLLTMLITTYVFSQILKQRVPDFPTYALSGVLLFNVFAQGSVAAMSNLTGNGPILSKLYIPPSVFVVSSVGSALVNFFYALIPLALIATIVDRVIPNIAWVLLVLPITEIAIFTTGMGLIVSALMVYFRDTFEIYTVLITLFNYLTPLFYPIVILSPRLKSIESFNPLFIFVDTFRSIVIDAKLPSHHELLAGGIFTVAAFTIGWIVFTRLERGFPYQF